MSSQSDAKGFFASLFDLSFSEFVTTRIIKVLYVLGIIGITLWALFLLFAGLSQGGGAALGALVGAVLGFFVGIIYLRVLLEFIAVVFRIAEHTSVIAHGSAGAGPGMPPPAAPGASGGNQPGPPQTPPPGPAS